MLTWLPDSSDRHRSFMRGLLFLVIGLIVGIMLAFGISGVSGYSSVTVECLPNGTYTIVNTSETVGIIMILTSFFILALAPLVYCQLKREYDIQENSL